MFDEAFDSVLGFSDISDNGHTMYIITFLTHDVYRLWLQTFSMIQYPVTRKLKIHKIPSLFDVSLKISSYTDSYGVVLSGVC